jgi:protein-S-isoprenylcysteine O-methyltransferase Ste14
VTPVDRLLVIRAAGLYMPMALLALVVFERRPRQREFGGMLLGFCWCLSGLLALQRLNLAFGWWTFHAQGGLFRGMPVDLYLGWALGWGALATLFFRRQPLWLVVLILAGLDALVMPLCAPVVELHRHWWMGELVGLLSVLAPAQCFARWTFEDSHLPGRAVLHVISSGGLVLFVVPEIVFAMVPGGEWSALTKNPAWLVSIQLQIAALLALPGVSAVQEFCRRGGGTPIPYDPPQRLVVSGFYRYVANPMQISCACVMTAWGLVLENSWIVCSGLIAFVYGLGLANWDEVEDMRARYGREWEEFRANVQPWRIRARPWHPGNEDQRFTARLYVAESCGPCSELRRWFESQGARGLAIVAAEDHPARDLERMTYEPADGSPAEEGVAAFARAVEHIHLGWAFVGAAMRLPVIRPALQLLADASGLGPQVIRRRNATPALCLPEVRTGN